MTVADSKSSPSEVDPKTAQTEETLVSEADQQKDAPLGGEDDAQDPSTADVNSEAGSGEKAQEQEAEPSPIDALMAENAQLRDDFLRAKAEAENARKRAQNEISSARRYALENFASELLTVRDSLDLARAVDLKEAQGVVDRVVEGLELTLRQLDSIFDRFSIYEISPAVGDRLDPEAHQAMSLIETAEVAPNHIFQVVQKGYRLNDRLLRPARVLVAKVPESEPKVG